MFAWCVMCRRCAPVRELRPLARLCVDKKRTPFFQEKAVRAFLSTPLFYWAARKGGATSLLRAVGMRQAITMMVVRRCFSVHRWGPDWIAQRVACRPRPT